MSAFKRLILVKIELMNFEFEKDEEYFNALLASSGGVEQNLDLFDFRDPCVKRAEFAKQRNHVFQLLEEELGNICQLQCHTDCAGTAEHVDHLIPLSSNELNKKLRRMTGVNGKKAPTQSFGSNNRKNFALACARCNSFKKHKFPSIEILQRVIAYGEGE